MFDHGSLVDNGLKTQTKTLNMILTAFFVAIFLIRIISICFQYPLYEIKNEFRTRNTRNTRNKFTDILQKMRENMSEFCKLLSM